MVTLPCCRQLLTRRNLIYFCVWTFLSLLVYSVLFIFYDSLVTNLVTKNQFSYPTKTGDLDDLDNAPVIRFVEDNETATGVDFEFMSTAIDVEVTSAASGENQDTKSGPSSRPNSGPRSGPSLGPNSRPKSGPKSGSRQSFSVASTRDVMWFLNGTLRPTTSTPDLALFPEDVADAADDRIINQLMYYPPGYDDNAPLKTIYMVTDDNDWHLAAGRAVFLQYKCPVDRCQFVADPNKADVIFYKVMCVSCDYL